MKAVILDAYSLNPGDLDWEVFYKIKSDKAIDWEIFDRTLPTETLSRAKDAEVLFTNKVLLLRDTLEQLPNLKYIGVLATGYNVVDIEAAHKLGITVTNVPAYSTNSVAQLVFAHILNIVNQVDYYSKEVKVGRWSSCQDFTFRDTSQIELANLTIGIMGLGKIGMKVAELSKVFGMKIIAFTSKDSLPDGIEKVSKSDLFRQSDILSLHVPLTNDTSNIINRDSLSLMKSSAILINTGRGGLVDENALANALNSDQLFAAGVDVLSTEPPSSDNPLLSAKNCYITPHLAWATISARKRLMQIAAENLQAFFDKKTLNQV
ncbi:D-2-hydroxyacid dehydrogenase [Bacteroidales bacterium OttesenSCG-928-M11]|nr:D-2-hydroxyacid dehydrogenase [Bacteroidales bacterium OttesenSCG-928-M11]